jgi:putative acyl-CoA dehydrogenase
MPLLYRGAVVNSIWEGSGNVAALDVLRAVARQPAGVAAFIEECELGLGGDRRLDRHIGLLRPRIEQLFGADGPQPRDDQQRLRDSQFEARALAEQLALALAGSLLVRHSPPAVADAFCAARIAREGGAAYGTLPAGVDAATIIDRALPA